MTGFFLHYSDDGQRWASYSESGDKQHSNVCHMFIRKSLLFVIFFFEKEKKMSISFLSQSHCYLGKCSEILETQCKDLWGASKYL